MIVSFSVSNFRSFHEEQTFSLVASERFVGDHPEHTVAIPGSDQRLLRAGLLYGANGAGKSNLLKALQFVKSLVGGRGEVARDPFRFSKGAPEPTRLDLRFIADGKLYGFGVSLDSVVREEWLIEIDGSIEKPLYERVTNQNGVVTVDAGGISGSERLSLLAELGARPDQCFLKVVNADSHPGLVDSNHLAAVLNWFRGLSLAAPGGEIHGSTSALGHNDYFRQFVGRFLNFAATGVEDIHVKERLFLDVSPDHNFLEGTEYVPEAVHNGSSLPLKDESDGTRRLLELAWILFSVDGHMLPGGPFFIDEIERGLHPMIVRKIFESFFNAPEKNSQLIATTHDSNLLDLDLFRRDEIWFAEKDPQGATHLYSLADFHVRNDEIQKHYLQGRFGAIPFLGGMNRLMEPALK